MECPVFPDEAALAAFCERNGIRRLSLFGSRLNGTAREDSDIDLLVEFFPDAIPTLFGVVRMEMELSRMTNLKVDLRTAGDLSRHFRDEVARTARLQYAT
jgi:predicted nucleotidyltransferase